MPVLTFPSLVPSSAQFGQIANTQSFTSPLAGTTQTFEMPGAHWHVRAVFDPLEPADRLTMAAFLAQCRGQAGRFYWGDPIYQQIGPAGVATGTPLVKGADQTGTSLITDGWTISQTNILKAGDYIHFDNTASSRELHMIVANVNSDGAGDATLTIEPAIRTKPADNAAITVTGAMCQMRLINDEQARWQVAADQFAGVTIEAIEAFTDAT